MFLLNSEWNLIKTMLIFWKQPFKPYQIILKIFMNTQPTFSSVSFKITDYQIACEVEQKRLKISVSALSQNIPSSLSLSEFISSNQAISFWISRKVEQEYRTPNEKNEETENLNAKNMFLVKKIEQLQRSYRSLETKVQIYSDQRKELWKLRKNDSKNKFVPTHCSTPSEALNKHKTQVSSNKLGELISEKEQEIYFLERKVNERDELVRELADGLMAANSQKEEIFNEYEKMLQTVVFQKDEEPILLPIILKEEIDLADKPTEQPKGPAVQEKAQIGEEHSQTIQITKEE